MKTIEWRRDIITIMFVEENAERILKILLLTTSQVDVAVWGGEASGLFYVRSAYKILQSLQTPPL